MNTDVITNNKVPEVNRKKGIEFSECRNVEQLVVGDTLHRIVDNLYFTLRGCHFDNEDHSPKKFKYYEFDGFQVNQKAMSGMFELEDFLSGLKGKRLKIYKYS